jgi:hypothetical protein
MYMKVVTVFQMILRLSFLIQIVLGILFWIGIVTQLIPLHMLIGLIFVISLWVIGLSQGVVKGGSFGLAAASFIVGLAIAIVGLFQQQWLVGSQHWIIEVIHLLLGLIGIGLGEMIAARTKRRMKSVATA